MEKIRQLPIIDLQKKYGNRAFQMQLVNEADTPIRVRLFGNGKTFAEIGDKADPDTPEPEPGLQPAIECIYIELLGMAALGKLVPGQLYCVTDYDVQDITIKFGATDVYIRSAKSMFTLVENRLFLEAVSADKVSCNGLLMNKNIGSYRFTDVIYDAPFSTGWMGEAPKWVDSTLANYRGCVVRMYNNAAGWDLPYDAFNMRVMNGPIDPVSLVWGANWNIRVAPSQQGWLRYVYDAAQPGSTSVIDNVEVLSMMTSPGFQKLNCMIGFQNCQNMCIHTRQLDGEELMKGDFGNCENIRGKFIVTSQAFITINSGLKNCTSDGTGYVAIGSGSEDVHLNLDEGSSNDVIDVANDCKCVIMSGLKGYNHVSNSCRNIKICNRTNRYNTAEVTVNAGSCDIEIIDPAGVITIADTCKDIKVIGGSGITVGESCKNISIDPDCENITIGSYCKDVAVGSDCSMITLRSSCENIHLMSEVSAALCGQYCKSVLFKTGCQAITIGNYFTDVEFGGNCDTIVFSSSASGGFAHGHSLKFGDDCNDLTVTNNETASSENRFQYVEFLPASTGEVSSISRDEDHKTVVGNDANGDLQVVPAIPAS